MNACDRRRSSNVHHWVCTCEKKPQLSADVWSHTCLLHTALFPHCSFVLLFIVFAYTSAVTFCSSKSYLNKWALWSVQSGGTRGHIHQRKEAHKQKKEQSSQSDLFDHFIWKNWNWQRSAVLIVFITPPTVLLDIHFFYSGRGTLYVCVTRLTGTAGPSHTHEPTRVILQPHFLTTHFLTLRHAQRITFRSPSDHQHWRMLSLLQTCLNCTLNFE